MNDLTPMTVREVCHALDRIAPQHLAEDWDQVGLQIGDFDAKVTKALVCIDYTPAVLREAVDKGCDFVVAYHPPMFKPLERLVSGYRLESTRLFSGPNAFDWKQDLLTRSVRAGLSIYSPHTALDVVNGGFCDMLCETIADGAAFASCALEPKDELPLRYKVVVFVPEANEVSVREAMSKAGAGGIGNYRECSFSTAGVGGFRPVQGAKPTVGSIGQREEVPERRLEMMVEGDILPLVIAAMRQAHPYEEPAFDVFQLEPQIGPDESPGTGRMLELTEAITAEALAARFAGFTGATPKLGGPRDRRIERIGVCPGAGGSLFENAAFDAVVTGEMQHHQVLDLIHRGTTVLLLGHTASERPLLPRYVEMIRKGVAGRIAWLISEADVTPWEMR